jgi:hypothetical protein
MTPTKRQRRGLGAAVAATSACALLVAVPLAAAKLPPRLLVHVKARIRVFYDPNHPHNSMFANRTVTLTPGTINVGTVVIDVANSDNESHRFQINGKTSKLMGAGGRATITVTFKHPGTYPVAVTSETPIALGGALRVVK